MLGLVRWDNGWYYVRWRWAPVLCKGLLAYSRKQNVVFPMRTKSGWQYIKGESWLDLPVHARLHVLKQTVTRSIAENL